MVNNIKTRLTCVDYAKKKGLPIARAGDRCKSPFHNGSNPKSMVVYDDFWYSFSDNMGGDVIDLCALFEFDGDRGRAIRALSGEQDDKWYEKTQNRCNLIALWHSQLLPEHRAYLHARRITDETIDLLRIGFTGNSGKLKNRIAIPFYKNDYVVSWVARTLIPDGEPKYVKPSNREAPEKSPWGLHTLHRPSDSLYICEGAFDGLSAEQSGYPVLATMGGYFGKQLLPMVRDICRKFKRVILTFDNDEGGRKFTEAFGEYLFTNRISFEIAMIPKWYKDLSDYYAAGNEIADLDTIDGLKYLCENVEDIPRFVRSAARFTTRDRLSDLFEVIRLTDRFTSKQLAELWRSVTTCPPESQIVQELRRKHPSLIFIENVGFYEYQRGVWNKLPETTVRGYAGELLGNFRTAQKVAAIANLIKPEIQTNVEFDRKPLWCFLNGTLELDTGKFRDSLPDDYCSIQMNYNYDADARSREWETFIEQITDGDPVRADVLQQIAGYVLFPDCRFHRIFIFTGNGRNGKSTYLMVLRSVFGENNCTAIPPEGLTKDFQLIETKDSVLNIGPDVKPSFTGTEYAIKSLAAGDLQFACYKGMKYISFVSRTKLVYSCNGQMKASDTSDGMVDRLLVVDFPCKFVDAPQKPNEKKKDPDLLPKLLKNLPGIFNWCYEGYNSLKRYKEFTTTYEQTEFNERFRLASNPVQAFCEDYDFQGEMTRSEIYERYKQWCEDTGHRPASREAFFPNFREIMKERICKETQVRRNGKRERLVMFDCRP